MTAEIQCKQTWLSAMGKARCNIFLYKPLHLCAGKYQETPPDWMKLQGRCLLYLHLQHKSNASHQKPTDFKVAVHMAVQRLLHVAQQRQSKSAQVDKCRLMSSIALFLFKCMHSTWKCRILQNACQHKLSLLTKYKHGTVHYFCYRCTMWNFIGSKPGSTSVIPKSFCTQHGSSPKRTCRARWAFHSSLYLIRMIPIFPWAHETL